MPICRNCTSCLLYTSYKVATTDELTQMYTANEFEYIKAPNPSYINKLIDNSSYELKQIWVLQDGKDEASTNEADWTIYDDPANVHFTNRDLKDEDGASAQNIIYLDSTKRNVLRLVYDTKEADFTTSATFYDYNISSGQNGDGKWCTGITGINIESNYPKDNEKTKWSDYRDILAFGNANCGTGMANYKFNGVYLNKYSGRNYGCTFGLAKSLSNGKIVYNDWLITPDLFNEGNANGKKSFENSSLTFSQVGDTYTLSSASVGTRSISGLQDFFNPSPKTDTTHTHISVSYTHLDVYKRQTASSPMPAAGCVPCRCRPRWSRRRALPPRATARSSSTASRSPPGAGSGRTAAACGSCWRRSARRSPRSGSAWACLLYTSRV